MSVLLLACSAVPSGAHSFAAIGQWARNAPQEALARLGARTTSVFTVRVAPSPATIHRIINRTCPGELADLLGIGPVGSGTLALHYPLGDGPDPTAWTALQMAVFAFGEALLAATGPTLVNIWADDSNRGR